MTISQLYHLCGNLHPDLFYRVLEKTNDILEPYEAIYRGSYCRMSEECKQANVLAFDFDKDLEGVLIIVNR